MSYLGRSAKLSLKAQEKVSFLATAGQTSKTGLSYTPSFIEVYVNGVLLTDTTDFTATNGNSITFTVALLLNDEVTVISLKTFTVADHYNKTEANTLLAAKSPLASPSFTGTVSADGLVVDSSGASTTFVEFKNSTGSGKWDIKQGGSNNTLIRGYNSSNTETIRLDPTSGETFFNGGNVGIGTTNPNTKLKIENNTDTDYSISSGTTNYGLSIVNTTSGANNSAGILLGTESNGEIYLSAVQNSGNSASDFRIATRHSGSRSDKFIVSSAGIVTKPYQPIISVSRDNSSLSFTTNQDVFASTSMLNWVVQGISHNTSNGRFTVPVAGKYYVHFFSMKNNTATAYFNVLKNGGSMGLRIYDTANATSWHSYGLGGVFTLAANDYLNVVCGSGATTNAHGMNHMNFTIHLIG